MKKMSLENKTTIIITCVVALIFIIGIVVLFGKGKISILSNNKMSSTADFNRQTYKGIVEYSGDINFFFIVDNRNRVSNILFLGDDSIKILANKKIEGKNVEDATYDVIDLLNGKKLLSKNIVLTSYQDNDSVTLIEKGLNRSLVVFGSGIQISRDSRLFADRIRELGVATNGNGNEIDAIKSLYDYSQILLSNSSINNVNNSVS